MARLHIICGNCGSNEHMCFSLDMEGCDYDSYLSPSITIHCNNCGTNHNLQDTIHEFENEKEFRKYNE